LETFYGQPRQYKSAEAKVARVLHHALLWIPPETSERPQELKAMQVETFLEKPYTAERLLTALQQLLAR
jgi:hypothetical protein